MNQFGIDQEHWEILNSLLIFPLKQKQVSIWVFGSRARGDYKKFSDIDILIDGPINDYELSIIKEALEESQLPIKVDIVKTQELAQSYAPQVALEKIKIE